jgi:acyl carrier protein
LSNVEQQITDYIVQEFLHDRPRDLVAGNLVEEGVVDSLGIMTLIAFVEKQFGARIRPEDVVVENFSTVAAIAHLVKQRSTT